MSNKNEVFEYLVEQLRQQVNNNPYKQQCEDLAHDVQSLKNQLRDASALVAELQETIKLMNEDFNRATNRGGPLLKGVSYVVGGHRPEQSGCRKEDAQECEHSWIIMPGLFLSEGNPNNVPGSELCSKCGKREWDDAEYKPENDTQVTEPWIKWGGGERPVDRSQQVDVIFRDGGSAGPLGASYFRWKHIGNMDDIIRYRVVKPGCEHEWYFYDKGASMMCLKCGLKK